MFIVKRTKRNTSHITTRAVHIARYEHDNLSDAIEHMEQLRRADSARYSTLVSKYPWFFADHDISKTSYHYTFGQCTISCEIIGVLEDAEKEVKYGII